MKFIVFCFSLFLLSSCASTAEPGEQVSSNYHLNESSTLEDFKGKPSAIIFGGTFCPHCKTAAPVFKEKVWDFYKDQANLWINVIDGGKFEVAEVAQGLNSNLSFDDLTQSECGYVPSWVVLDAFGNVFDSSCGTVKPLETLVEDLEKLLKVSS